MTAYCTCGHPNQYTLKKPNFCQSCGKTMGSSFASVAAEKKPLPQSKVINHPRRRTLDVYDDDEDEGQLEYVPDIHELSFEVEGAEESYAPQTLESLIFNNPVKPTKKGRKVKHKIDKNAFSNIMSKAKGEARSQDLE